MKRQWLRSMFMMAVSILFLTGVRSEAKVIALWKMDEIGGLNVPDSSGNDNDGEVVFGTPVWDSTGRFDGCLKFDGTYGVEVSSKVFDEIDTALTISVWLKGDANQTSRSTAVFQAGESRGRPYIVSIYTAKKDGSVTFATGHGEADTLKLTVGPLKWAGRWNHYVFVKDALSGIQRIYLNGKLAAERTDAFAPMVGVKTVRIGMASDRQGDQFWGKMDQMCIYNRALDSDEISYLYRPQPFLDTVFETARKAEARLERSPREAIILLLGKLSEAEAWRRNNPTENLSYYKHLYFDLCCLLARAKEAIGLPKDEIEAAYERAILDGTPLPSNCAHTLFWLLKNGNIRQCQAIVRNLNGKNRDYLKQVCLYAADLLEQGKSMAAVDYLEHNLKWLAHWRQRAHPVTDVVSEQRLPEVYFQLAKAREAAGADKKAIAQAYQDTFRHSRLDYIPQRTTAFAWLLERNFLEQCRSIISSNENEDEIAEPLATTVLNLCRHYQTEKDWAVFERLLDVLFSQSKCPHRWAMLVESAFDDRHGRWAKKYFEYVRTRPRLVFERDRAYAERKVAEGRYNEAARLYEALLSRCGKEDRAQVEFELYRTMFLAGQYQAVIPKLEDYIAKQDDRVDLVEEAMLMEADAQAQLGRFSKAIELCSAVCESSAKSTNRSKGRFYTGYYYMLQGDTAKAKDMFNKVLQDFPDSSYADKARICLSRIAATD